MGMPHGVGAAHPSAPGGPEGHPAILTEIAPLLPHLLGAFQDLDPGTREMLMKQLAGLGIHALGGAAPKAEAKGCCGTCKGEGKDCERCPSKGDCPNCPKEGAGAR